MVTGVLALVMLSGKFTLDETPSKDNEYLLAPDPTIEFGVEIE
jgi:hypothetical protein